MTTEDQPGNQPAVQTGDQPETHELADATPIEQDHDENYTYHVLVVEDNKTNQFIAEAMLEQAGMIVEIADNGQLGYDFFAAHQHEIDIILMDLHMPVMNGYDSARKIREIDQEIPIVAMTADAISGVDEECRQAGIYHYLSKPFDPVELEQVVQKLARKKAIRSETRLLNQAEGLKLIGNDADLYRQVLQAYYSENVDGPSRLQDLIESSNYAEAAKTHS